MANTIKEQQDILEKLNIFELNTMQEEALSVIDKTTNTIILSPTGSGKTLAFLLPIITLLDPECTEVQALILVPSRELAIQIEQVVRSMGSGYKVNAIYGGRAISKDKIELKHTPAILIGTPGRIADHFNQERFSTKFIKILVIDEFDKSFEVASDGEIKDILSYLPSINKRILTSATAAPKIPGYIRLDQPIILDYLQLKNKKLTIKTVVSPSKSKLKTLLELLIYVGNEQGIVFCNYKESIVKISDFLTKSKISHGCFYAGMDQQERERSLIKLKNRTYQVIIATDVAARGIDIPEMKFVVHYEVPSIVDEFTHRNGRTARVDSKGTAYVLKWEEEILPEFVKSSSVEKMKEKVKRTPQYWETLFISGGRKDKISKGDIAGMFFKQGNLTEDQLGLIDLKQDCAFVAVPITLAKELVTTLNNSKLKNKKVRVTIV
ncbi:DEAD/DEAH box helicase [Lutibacter sp.]|uniref:DEAD/DEAH box helicase n=1 Tax=Lutibacter sp. TaxID=1925666 RepID=UPI002735F94B|nr:DEAD/DEAH box helicase [Lutibacter sp.]MDP3313387.1 DEAD/DEAH box helicase [Lutibacter sp.]